MGDSGAGSAADARDSGHFVRESLRMSGGVLIWGAQLAVLYAWGAVACARGFALRQVLGFDLVRLGSALTTVAALGGAALLLAQALRDLRRGGGEAPGEGRRFASVIAAWIAGFALVAIVWLGIPALLVAAPCR